MSDPREKKATPARMAVPQAWESQRLYCRMANRHWARTVAGFGFTGSGGLGWWGALLAATSPLEVQEADEASAGAPPLNWTFAAPPSLYLSLRPGLETESGLVSSRPIPTSSRDRCRTWHFDMALVSLLLLLPWPFWCSLAAVSRSWPSR